MAERDVRVLVVGATGFVGGHALRALADEPGVEGIAACRRPERLDGFDGEVRVGDLRDPRYRAGLFEGVDVVCLAAAWSALHGNADRSRRLFLEPLLATLDAAVEAGVQRVVFPSSVDVSNLETTRFEAFRTCLSDVWPHLANVVAIEEAMARHAESGATMISLRLGIFTGPGVTVGFLPVLLPWLARRMVPLVDGGAATARLVDGADVGRAFARAALAEGLTGFEAFDIVGDDPPTFREVYEHLRDAHGYPFPAFDVSTRFAWAFASVAERLFALTPFDPPLTRSLLLLSEAFAHDRAPALDGFAPRVDWRDSVSRQVAEIRDQRVRGRMVAALPAGAAS